MTTPPNKAFRATILTLFPELFPGVLSASLIGNGVASNIWQLEVVDLKNFAAKAPSHHIDGPPAGGGAGMVLRPDIVAAAIDSVKTPDDPRPLIYLTPAGQPLTQSKVQQLSQLDGVIILCGRYEGVDQRVLDARGADEISIGDFVLAGGEVAAQAMLEAVIRLKPDIVGSPKSLVEESFAQDQGLEYPHYTRPREWEGHAIPEILLSGDHQRIADWRRAQAQARTRARRPDLLKG